MKEALRFAGARRWQWRQFALRPIQESTGPTHDRIAAHGASYYVGDQCGQDRLRRRCPWIVRCGPDGPGVRLPMRSGWPINDTTTCSVVSQSRFCSAGRWVARGRPCQRRRWPTAAGGAASSGRTAICAACRRRGRNTVVWSARIPQGDLARVPQRRPERIHLRTRADGSRTAAAVGSVGAGGPTERRPVLVRGCWAAIGFVAPPLRAKRVARDDLVEEIAFLIPARRWARSGASRGHARRRQPGTRRGRMREGRRESAMWRTSVVS